MNHYLGNITSLILALVSNVGVISKLRHYLSISQLKQLYYNLTIGSCFSVHYRVMEHAGARGKFGEHERSVRVARGVTEGNSNFLSALQTSQVLHNSIVHS